MCETFPEDEKRIASTIGVSLHFWLNPRQLTTWVSKSMPGQKERLPNRGASRVGRGESGQALARDPAAFLNCDHEVLIVPAAAPSFKAIGRAFSGPCLS